MAVKNYHLYLAAKEHSLLMIYVGGIESIPNIYICEEYALAFFVSKV